MHSVIIRILGHAKDAAERAADISSTAKQVLEAARKVSAENYRAETEKWVHDDLYGNSTEQTANKIEAIWNRNDETMGHLVDGAKKLARLDHDIPMLSGFLDVHKELFPNMPPITYDDISNAAKEKIGDKRNCWQISIVNGRNSIFSSMVTVARGKLVKALEKHQPVTLRQNREAGFIKRFYQNAVVNLLTKGDALLRDCYESKLSGTYKLDDICMEVYDMRLKNLVRENARSAKQNGADFALAFSESNLWRCGISKNIPGWFRYMKVGQEDTAWTLAYLKAGLIISEEGLKWDRSQAEERVDRIYHTYMHGDVNGLRWKNDLQQLAASLIHEHEIAKTQMEQLREEHGRTKLSEYESFNPEFANEKERDDEGQCYKTNEDGYMNADIEEIKKKYKYLCIQNGRGVALMEFPNPDENMDLEKRQNVETSASVGILGENGYCSRMRMNHETDHTHNDTNAKQATIRTNYATAAELLVDETLNQYARNGGRDPFCARNREICKKMISMGYTASVESDSVRFTDPDGIRGHSFDVRLDRGEFQMISSRYAESLKEEMLNGIIEHYALQESVAAAKILEQKTISDPMYRFAKQVGNLMNVQSDGLLAGVRAICEIQPDDILNPQSRERKVEWTNQMLSNFDVGAIQTEQQECLAKMENLKELAGHDQKLAWCKIVMPDCERTEDGIIGHATDGTEIKVSENGQVAAERNTVESVKTMGQMFDALQNMQRASDNERIATEPECELNAEEIDAAECAR